MRTDALSDTQAEASAIATLIFHPEFILHTEYLKAKHFSEITNGCYYWAISELYKAGIENIDAINISQMLSSNSAVKRKVEEYNVQDVQQFIDLAQYAARHTLEEYKLLAKCVVTMSYKRDLYKATTEMQSYCFDDGLSLSDVNKKASDRLTKLGESYIVSDEIVQFSDMIDDLWAEVEESRNDGMVGLPFKSPTLTKYCQHRKSELILLSARMKRGKSAFFLNETCNMMKAGVPCLYIDTEMTSKAFMLRLLANLTNIPVNKIESGNYNNEEADLILKAREWVKTKQFVHMYMPVYNEAEILEIHKILKYKMNLEFSVYDYLKCNEGDSSEISSELGSRIDFLKNVVAGSLDLSVFAGAQMSRENKLADSDKLERYCSTSLYWREKTPEEIQNEGLKAGNYCLRVALNRNGPSHAEDEYINFNFRGDTMKIFEAEVQGRQETPFE